MSVYRSHGSSKSGPAAPGEDDRRGVCRYSAVQTRAWLGWWENEVFRSTPAQLLDISLRGCRMTVDQLPQIKAPLWFCPPGVGETAPSSQADWIEAKLIDSRRRLFGPRLVRVVFRKSFPYEVFKAVVYGRERVGGLRPNLWVPEGTGSQDRDWW